MTISAYTGLPGHGKSYGVVENVIVPCLKQMRTVFTNIPMYTDKCIQEFGISVIQFDVRDIVDNPNWWTDTFIAGSVLVLDEVWRLWPSGLKANNVRDSDKSFLAEHRHMVGENGMSTEIVLVTQDLQQIASFARCLVESTFRVTKLSNIGFDKLFRLDVYHGPVTGVNPPASKKLNTFNGKRTKFIQSLYKSHTKSDIGAGNEARVDKRFNVLRSQKFYFYLIFVFVVLIFFYFALINTLQSYGLISKDAPKIGDSGVLVAGNSVLDAKSGNAVVKVQELSFKFLSLASDVYISYNNGHFPNIKYSVAVKIGQTYSYLSIPDLISLKYKVKPVSSCLIVIEGQDYNSAVMCQIEERKQGFIEKAVTGVKG